MKKILKITTWGIVIIGLIIAGTGASLWYLWSSNLPNIETLKEYNPPVITEIYSADGEIIGRFWSEKSLINLSGI